MKFVDSLFRFFARFRYPISLPEDIAKALGIPLSNFQNFHEIMAQIIDPQTRPLNLEKFMLRGEAEKAFGNALRREHFQHLSLYFYHFNGGWLSFMLQFDEQSRLRRLYVQHKDLDTKHEIAIS